MLPRYRISFPFFLSVSLALWISTLQAQNTAPVPTTFEIVSPSDGNAASLINHDYSTNKKIFYGGDFSYIDATNSKGFLGYTVGGNKVATMKARGNPGGSRLTLGGTEWGTDAAFGAEGKSYVANLPGSRWLAASYDPDDLGNSGNYLVYTGMNGFIAINEGDTLEILLTGFIDPNNLMTTGNTSANGDYSGRYLKSQDGDGVEGFDGAQNVTFSVDNLPQGATFQNGRLHWVPNFLQGNGAVDDKQRNSKWFIDANISNGSTSHETTPGDESGSVGRGLGELKDSLYVIYFRATDDSKQPNNWAVDSLFILVNDSLANPSPRLTRRTILRIDSLDNQLLRTYNYLAGQPDTLFSVFEGDSAVIIFYAEDQNSSQGGTNDNLAFSMLWNDSLLSVPKGGLTTGIAGFNQFIHRAGRVDTLAVDTTSTVSGGSATSFRIKIQIPFNLAASNEKTDTLVVMVSDGTTIVADTFDLKVRNTNRPPIWDGVIASRPSDSALVFSPNPKTAQPDSVQTISPFTLNNNRTDSTNFSHYVYDPDPLIGDSLGYQLTYSATGNHKGTLNSTTGLNVYTPTETDTVTYTFTVTASDSYTSDPKSTAQVIKFRVAPAPDITRVEPSSGSVSQEFTIYGSGFGLYDGDGPDTSKVIFYATNTSGVRQNIRSNIISWAKDKIVASIPSGVPPSLFNVAVGYFIPDTIMVVSAIYGGFDPYPFTVLVDSSGFENVEVVNITATSAVIRYRTSFTGADSVVVASSSDTLDIHSTSFSYPTFVEHNSGLSLIRSSVSVFHDLTSSSDGIHVVQLTGLTPNTLYRFFIGSANRIYAADSLRNTNGPYRPKKIDLGNQSNNTYLDAFRLRTLTSTGSTGSLFTVMGKAYYSNGAAENATVTLRLVKHVSPADTSLPINTTVSSDSVWVFNLADLKAKDGTSFAHDSGDVMMFTFDGAEKGFEEYDTLRAGRTDTTMIINKVKLVPYVNYAIELKTGLNLIGVPLNLFKGEPTTAQALLNLIQGGRPSLSRYLSSTARLETVTRAASGGYVGDTDFNLQIGQAYYIGVSSLTTIQLNGRYYTRKVPVISFPSTGYYFVSRPAQDNSLFYSWDAQQLLQNPKIRNVISYDATLQMFKQYFRYGTGYTGTNFGIDVGQGYILDISSATSWDPNGTGGTLLAADGAKSSAGPGQAIVLDIASRQAANNPGFGVMVSNITSVAAVFAWMTGQNDPGQLRLALPEGKGEKVIKPEASRLAYGMSYALVTDLKPSAEYTYRLENSSGLPLDTGTQGKFTTAEIGAGIKLYTLFGRLVDVSGASLKGMLVMMRLKSSETGTESDYISTVSDENGYWALNLANLKEKATGLPFSWNEGDDVELTIIGGAFRSRYTAKVQPGSPHNIALDLEADKAAGENAQNKKPVSANLPKAYSLAQNFPNPFNPSTTIAFAIPEGASKAEVRLDVYNLRGQLVNTLLNRTLDPGEYKVQWEGMDSHGQLVPSGVYFYRLVTPQFKATRKMVILK